MSLRSDYELSVSVYGKGVIPEKAIREFIAAIPYDANLYNENDKLDDGSSNSFLIRHDDGRSFDGVLYDIHPEEITPWLAELSRQLPALVLEVNEYVREATEMVEAGRNTYRLQDGKVVTSDQMLGEDIRALLIALQKNFDPAHSTDKHYFFKGPVDKQLFDRMVASIT